MSIFRNARKEDEISVAPLVLPRGSAIKGELESPGEIRIEGVFDGTVNVQALIIAPSGKLTGTARAKQARIEGTFEGTLCAGDTQIASTARLMGEIEYATLEVERGAIVQTTYCGSPRNSDDHQDRHSPLLITEQAPHDEA